MGAFYGPPNSVKEHKVFLYGFFEKKIKCTSLDGGMVTRVTIPAESLFEISELDLPKNKITLIHYDITGAKVGNSYWSITMVEPGTVGFAMNNVVERLAQTDWDMAKLTRYKLAFVMLVNEEVCVISGKREFPLYEEKQKEEE